MISKTVLETIKLRPELRCCSPGPTRLPAQHICACVWFLRVTVHTCAHRLDMHLYKYVIRDNEVDIYIYRYRNAKIYIYACMWICVCFLFACVCMHVGACRILFRFVVRILELCLTFRLLYTWKHLRGPKFVSVAWWAWLT